MADLDQRGIVTKRRNTKFAKYNGGIPFTYGPLAYFLKNRVYLGEVHHHGKWFEGEHEAIVDRQTFEQVQELLKANTVKCKTKYSESGALLKGKLFDDRGNHMGPSFSGKNGVRYRFYVSTALRGRKHKAGSVTRVAASEIEGIVSEALRQKLELPGTPDDAIADQIERIVLGETLVCITLKSEKAPQVAVYPRQWRSPGHEPKQATPTRYLRQTANPTKSSSKSERFSSIEGLATTAKLHPKVVRQALRLAFLSPELTSAILEGDQPGLTLRQIPKRLPLPWTARR